MTRIECDVLIIGGSLAAAACAKRCVDSGLKTIVIEKKKLPRHKICSGILSPRGHRFLKENFGPLPQDILHEPHTCDGVIFHFPSLKSLSMDFNEGATPHLHRKFSDFWALKASGAEIHDETTFLNFKENEKNVISSARKSGQQIDYVSRWIVGADGPSSTVARMLYSDKKPDMPMFFVGQKFHEIIDCPLDPQYFHFWFHPDLGKYVWSHARDNKQIVGVGFEVGKNFDEEHLKVAKYLENKHGVKLAPAEESVSEGCMENFGPSLINKYKFGRGRVLITGQASGFLNMLAEGMSCALHSGAIAGESIVESHFRNKPVQDNYRQLIRSEVNNCTDQWNPVVMLMSNPFEADPKGELKKLGLVPALKILKEVWVFVKTYKHYKWGRQILKNAFYRFFKGYYPSKSWR